MPKPSTPRSRWLLMTGLESVRAASASGYKRAYADTRFGRVAPALLERRHCGHIDPLGSVWRREGCERVVLRS